MIGLVMYLKCREILFEKVLSHEHFEDEQVDKRFWMVSPEDFYAFGVDFQVPAQKWIETLNILKPKLAKFRSSLRNLYDYRFLVDWGYGRLWKKMYLFLKPEDDAVKNVIKDFSKFATTHSKLAFDLFALHPLDLNEFNPDACSVCLDEWERDDIAIE
jgi:hypothetical protein